MNNLTAKLESLNMDNDLSNLLSNLSINNNDNNAKFLDIKCVLYANHTTEGYILLVNSENYFEEMYQGKSLEWMDDVFLKLYFENDTFHYANFYFSDEANIVRWPVDYSNFINIYDIDSQYSLRKIGEIVFPNKSSLFYGESNGDLRLFDQTGTLIIQR